MGRWMCSCKNLDMIVIWNVYAYLNARVYISLYIHPHNINGCRVHTDTLNVLWDTMWNPCCVRWNIKFSTYETLQINAIDIFLYGSILYCVGTKQKEGRGEKKNASTLCTQYCICTIHDKCKYIQSLYKQNIFFYIKFIWISKSIRGQGINTHFLSKKIHVVTACMEKLIGE